MMISKLKALGLVGGLVTGLVLGTALASGFSGTRPVVAQVQKPSSAPVSAASKQQDVSKSLAKEQLKLAREALESLDALSKVGRVDNLDTRAAVWERRQIEALKACGVGRSELVSALENYVKRMKELTLMADERSKQARLSHMEVLDWQYRLSEAEMWLYQEKSQ